MKIEGKISIFIGRDSTTIEIYDTNANIKFCQIELTPEQLSSALSRLSYTECKSVHVMSLDKVGKKHEHKTMEFELPRDVSFKSRHSVANIVSLNVCPEGWTPDNYFGSQDSFFQKDGKQYARCIIRRYV